MLSQLLDVAFDLEELGAACYVLDRPVEADGICLARLVGEPLSTLP